MKNNKHILTNCKDCEHKIAGKSIFCCLGLEELGIISDNKRNMSFKKGQTIFSEGNQPHGIYCINKGKVKIHKLGEEGKEQIVRLAGNASLIGYRAIFSEDCYYASATAIEETNACYIPKYVIIDFIKNNPNFSFSMMDLLSDDLKRAEEKITHMAQKYVRERIAEAILLLKEAYGLKTDNTTIDSALTRKELANIAGTTTETSIRILSEFQNDRVIDLSGKNIKILNLNKLIRIANILD